ncbi:MAG: prolyl oligopeptidase family serine peptidase, partial [Muribaculaceae bacterium]|nr:prolyl oligopeptidase family serine peptidase [Muribaculaceae bacterium]
YPGAGQPNSVGSVHSYDVDTRKTKEIALKDPRIEYIPRIAFGGEASDRLMVVTLDRAQRRMEIYAANPKSTVAKSVLVEEAKAWLNPMAYENLTFAGDGFVVMSERTGFNQAYKYSYNGELLRRLSSGDSDVTAYYGEDPLGNVYYQAVPPQGAPAGAVNRQVFKADKTGKKIEALSPAEGWSDAQFAPSFGYYMLSYSDAATPAVYTLYSGKGKKQRVVEDNAAYAASYAGVPVKEFFTMQSDGNTLNGYMIKPAGFSPSKKYPVIMWQYSGPGSQEVVNRWKMDWGYYAAANGFLVVCVDGRGTGARGTAFRDVVYKRLGYFETVDQIAAARYVASLPYADADRIGICGWSYGGYETLMAVTAQDSPFAAAVAIAPVTSWRYYDTVYAERYMLTPQENPDGYDESAPVNRAARLSCPLLVMHGTSDDNVHLQNTIEFASRLQENDRYCDLWLFPAMN